MGGRPQFETTREGLTRRVETILEDIEVVQAIQEPGHIVALVAGKRTIVRVYVGTNSNTPIEVRGVVTATRAGSSWPLRVPSLNTVTVDPAQNRNTQAKRENLAQSLNFLLPGAATVTGDTTFELVTVSDPDSGAPYELVDPRDRTVTFVVGAPLRLRLLGIRYRTAGSPNTFVPTQHDVDLIFSWLRRAYPIAELDATYTTIDANRQWPFTASQINAQLAAIRRQDVQAGTDQRTHYYGLVSDGGGPQFMRGRASGIPSAPDPSVVASGPTGDSSFGWDFDGVFGDWYTAHELGHTLGRRHPGFCAGQPVDDTKYPYANGQLSDASSPAFVGLDVGDSAEMIPLAALPGTLWHDVMTYCENQWLSDYAYEGIRLRLAAENELGSGAEDDETGLDIMTAATAARHVNVIATLNLTTGEGSIEFVQPAAPEASSPPASEDDREATLRITDSGGAGLANYPVPLRLESCSDNEDETASLDVVVALPEGAASLILVYQDEIVATFERSASPSEVSGIRAMRGASAAIEGLMWDSAEASDPNVTYTVQVSRGVGERWETVGVGRADPNVNLEPAEYPGLSSVRVRVIATNGFESTSVSETEVALD